MHTDKPDEGTPKPRKRLNLNLKGLSLETIALIGALALSMLGIGITDYAPLSSHRYWGAMTLVLAVAALVIGWSRAKRLGLPLKQTLATQVTHWLTTIAAMGGIFLLLKSGRLNYENTGLVLLMTLGFSTLLDGYRINWRFSLIGLLMFVTSIAAAYIEEYLWIMLIVATAAAAGVIYWEKHRKSKKQHT